MEKPRSKWLEEGYGWINTITQGWLAAATRSPVPAWRNTRAERNGRNGRDITTPLLVIEIIRCLDTRPRLRLPSFSSSPLFFSFCLSVDPSPYILATADKTADGRVWKLGEEGPSMAARNEPVVVVIEGGGGVRASLRPPTRLPLNIWINVDLSRVFFFFEQVWDESSSWKMFLWELLSFAKSRSFVGLFDL